MAFDHVEWVESYESALLARLVAEQAVEVSRPRSWSQRPVGFVPVPWAEVDDAAFELRHAEAQRRIERNVRKTERFNEYNAHALRAAARRRMARSAA